MRAGKPTNQPRSLIFHTARGKLMVKHQELQIRSKFEYNSDPISNLNIRTQVSMKSLASITDKDIETMKMALNDSISDMNTELKQELSPEKKNSLVNYKAKYSRVFDKLKQSGSIYALIETELDVVAGGLNDAMELIEENLTDDLSDEESEEILAYKNDCQKLVDLLAL
jgi:hypothetical protein